MDCLYDDSKTQDIAGIKVAAEGHSQFASLREPGGVLFIIRTGGFGYENN
jgi:hypothetical protein